MKLPALMAVCFVMVWAVPSPAPAMFAMPQPVPVDRIVKNTEAKLAKTPEDLEMRYQLARVHYLAFALKKSALGAFGGKEDEIVAEQVASKLFQSWSDKKGTPLSAGAALAHAARAAELFQQVLDKKPKHALAQLGMGSLLEQFAGEAEKNPPKEMPASLAQHDGPTIRKHYEVAFEQAWKSDQKIQSKGPLGLEGFISYEAATAYVRSAKADEKTLTPEEKENLGWMQEALKKMEALPMGPITPLIFSLPPAESIGALLAPERTVRFDLRGFGLAEQWSWVRAETGILVWDPERTGRITSARQLLGSYTWQLFWENGFSALAALDDDGDGWLRGAELEGLSVWRDRNQNGVSEPGEVETVEALGITGLACAATGNEGVHPVHRAGIELRDGRVLPMWDWVTRPVQGETARR